MTQEQPGLLMAGQPIKPTTLAEVARIAGVNKSTASRALNGDPAISEETRQRIVAVAAELHYVPNASASRMNSVHTNILAFTSHAIAIGEQGADPFLAELLASIMEEAHHQHYDILLGRVDRNDATLSTYSRIMGGRHADGCFVTDLRPDDERLPYLMQQGYPHVLFGRSHESITEARSYPYPWVEVDNYRGARLGTEHLLSLGHRRIAFIGANDFYYYEQDRRRGYAEALLKAGIACDPKLDVWGAATQEESFLLTQQLLVLDEPPTAIFAISDILAVGVMRAAHAAGRTIGREFSVMGFDGLGLGAYMTPRLTTLRQPISVVGRLLVQQLTGILTNTLSIEPHILLNPELHIRESTIG